MHRREFVRSVAGSGALASGLPLFASAADAALPLRFSTLKDAWPAARFETRAAWCLNYWYDAKRLVYRFPLKLAGGKAKRCLVLNEASGKEPPK